MILEIGNTDDRRIVAGILVSNGYKKRGGGGGHEHDIGNRKYRRQTDCSRNSGVQRLYCTGNKSTERKDEKNSLRSRSSSNGRG
nr:MAG TPA: hypothetical protein [Caudoviricetes sp.]